MLKKFDEFRINEADENTSVYNIKDIIRETNRRYENDDNIDYVQKSIDRIKELSVGKYCRFNFLTHKEEDTMVAMNPFIRIACGHGIVRDVVKKLDDDQSGERRSRRKCCNEIYMVVTFTNGEEYRLTWDYTRNEYMTVYKNNPGGNHQKIDPFGEEDWGDDNRGEDKYITWDQYANGEGFRPQPPPILNPREARLARQNDWARQVIHGYNGVDPMPEFPYEVPDEGDPLVYRKTGSEHNGQRATFIRVRDDGKWSVRFENGVRFAGNKEHFELR